MGERSSGREREREDWCERQHLAMIDDGDWDWYNGVDFDDGPCAVEA